MRIANNIVAIAAWVAGAWLLFSWGDSSSLGGWDYFFLMMFVFWPQVVTHAGIVVSWGKETQIILLITLIAYFAWFLWTLHLCESDHGTFRGLIVVFGSIFASPVLALCWGAASWAEVKFRKRRSPAAEYEGEQKQ